MDFDSYAGFAVDLVSSSPDELDPADPLTDLDGLKEFLVSRPWMAERAVERDIAPLVRLRSQLREVFDAAHEHRSAEVVDRLNRLLAHHRPQPSISGHDDADWHLHVADDQAPVATEYATGAVMGLAMAFLEHGVGGRAESVHAGLGRERLDEPPVLEGEPAQATPGGAAQLGDS